MGKPVYPIERINLAAGTFFEDGECLQMGFWRLKKLPNMPDFP